MNRKRVLISCVIVLILGVLVYAQFRTWKNFDWRTFWLQTDNINLRHIVHGIGLIYISYFLRALRWKIFLRPVRPKSSAMGLLPPTIIGFTGLAILGRPGELIRPYLVARRENLSFASQLGVWAIERIFDIGGFTILMVAAIFLPSKLHYFAAARPAYNHWLHVTGYVLIALVLGLFTVAMLTFYKGETIAHWIETRFAHLGRNIGQRIAVKMREFAFGLHTIHDLVSFLQLSAVSVLLWWLIAVAYKEVTHAYGAPMSAMSVTKVLLLMGSSMVGSLVQLPGVGGGSQLATISALDHVFDIPKELAASCGIMLWLVTFVSVIPIGLALAHRERLSLRKLSSETAQEEEEVVSVSVESPPA
jgi:glycosyltransferase 2 family protein